MIPAPAQQAHRVGPDRIRLGLIGDSIRRSRSPDLHRIAGGLSGLDVTYDLLIPGDLGMSFADVLDSCRTAGMRGVNVTYPYKEEAVAYATIADPDARRIGSINTIVFETTGPTGHNTDHTGFIAAYRATFGDASPGRVAIVGAGGVGKAVAFALAALGAEGLAIVDTDTGKADALAAAVSKAEVVPLDQLDRALLAVDGVANCTPLGMAGYPGSSVRAECLGRQRWAFDAVYTPVATEFVRAAGRAGLQVMSGYELFFHQGIQAFEIFTGARLGSPRELRARLAETAAHQSEAVP